MDRMLFPDKGGDMWIRSELKAKGKENFKKNYWKCVIAGAILAFATTAAQTSSSKAYGDEVSSQGFILSPGLVFAALGTISVLVIIAVLIDIFVMNPLEVGSQRFFAQNAKNDGVELSEILYGFKNGLANIAITIFLRDLFICLWSILFVIPGIVKAYSYRMVPFILSDDPTMNSMEVIAKSRQMMKGHKWNAFVLDLSFIGWDILSIITLGIVGVFYAVPYQYATNAELYHVLKEN